MNPIEIVAAVFGVVSVFLSVRQNIWSWPTAIVNVGLYIFVFFESKLYGDTGLQVVYVILNAYGWYHWLYGGKNRTELPVSRTSLRLGAFLMCAMMNGFYCLKRLRGNEPITFPAPAEYSDTPESAQGSTLVTIAMNSNQ